jgi:hypothetical protein
MAGGRPVRPPLCLFGYPSSSLLLPATSHLPPAFPDRSQGIPPLAPASPKRDHSNEMIRLLRFAPSLLALALATSLQAQSPVPSLPFGVGERLEFRVVLSRFGDVGHGVMRVESDSASGGRLWLMRFELEAGKGPIRAVDRTASWFDPTRFAIERFEKRERHPLSRSAEVVTIDRAARTFTDSGKAAAALGSDLPLDELSFLYLLRTLPVDRDTTMSIDRHFDPARNPTIVRVRAGDVIETPVGLFRTRLVEMEVRDPKRYRGTGIIKIHLSDDACRIPVRIESRMPVLGVTTLTLAGWASPPRYPGALLCEG